MPSQPAIRSNRSPLQTPFNEFEVLDSVEWNFPDRKRHSDLEAIHPYPAKFIPDLPGAVLDLISIEPGTAVLDPFVGSGTTLVECQKRGIHSIGIDLNPIACMIARVKTRSLPQHFDTVLENVLSIAMKTKQAAIPEIPNLDHWFERPIQNQIAKLVATIEQTPNQFRDILRLALSSILVRVSNQDSDTRYAAIQKGIVPDQVPTFFATACRRVSSALQHRGYNLTPAVVLERDTLTTTPRDFNKRVGAVITSPPYPNAYEYWLYHKYRMFWLGHDPLWVKQHEIGARAHFFKTNRHTADNFVEQMRRTFHLIDSVLVSNGYACFVVGRSKIHGQIVDNAAIIEDVASKFRFKTAYKTERVIASNRKSFNLSHASIKTETILVLAK
jgi:DNA modification methylase